MCSDAIALAGVSKRYRRYRRRAVNLKHALLDRLARRADVYEEFAALEDITLSVPRGQVVGIIGANGSGKSTILKILSRIAYPDRGTVHVHGRVSSLLELGAGFNADLSGRKNIYFYAALLGLTRRSVDSKIEQIIAFSELGDFIDNPVRHYSSGMYIRLGFSVAVSVDPEILLLDEVLAVGDASFQQKCLERILDFKRRGKTIVLVTHSMSDVLSLCDRAILLSHGRIVADGAPHQVVAIYQHAVEQASGHQAMPASGEAPTRLRSARIRDRFDQPVAAIASGSPASILIEYFDLAALRAPNITVAFQTAAGVPVVTLRTPDSLTNEFLARGAGTAQLNCQHLPLAKGSYVVTVSLADGNAVTDRLSHALPLEVGDTPGAEGIVAIPHTWTVGSDSPLGLASPSSHGAH